MTAFNKLKFRVVLMGWVLTIFQKNPVKCHFNDLY